MSSSVERTVLGRKYIYQVDNAGEPEYVDETNERTKYESDLSSYLPLTIPKLNKNGSIAIRQPWVSKRNSKWWKAQCGFRGLPVGGSIAELQARVRAHGDKGMGPKIKEAFESAAKESVTNSYDDRIDSDKAKSRPKKFLEDVFGESSSRRNEVVVLEVAGWGEPIEKAARELKVCCEVRKMQYHEPGQRRAVVGLNALRVRAKMAEFDMEDRRAAQRAREEREEEEEEAQREFQEQMRLAKSREGKTKGPWNVSGEWQVSCPYIEGQWGSDDQGCSLQIGTTKPDGKGRIQMYAEFAFIAFTGIMRFVSSSTSPTSPDAANFFLPTKALPSSSNKTVKFRWRGEETGEGEIQLGADEEVCSMTFHSPDAFTGTFIGPMVGTVEFEGHKSEGRVPHSDPAYAWQSRGAEAYEAARVGRWH